MIDRQTIAVYDSQIDAYENLIKKQSEDPALLNFIEQLKPGGYILDLGCGPAIASSTMRDNGLQVDAIDASAEMVRLANEKFNIGARQAYFSDITGSDIYDGIWANFSLLHASASEFTSTLTKLYAALRSEGVLHLGMKIGSGSSRDKLGRYYSYYTEKQLRDHLNNSGFKVENVDTREGRGLAGDIEQWIFILSKKP